MVFWLKSKRKSNLCLNKFRVTVRLIVILMLLHSAMLSFLNIILTKTVSTEDLLKRSTALKFFASLIILVQIAHP